MYLNETYWTKRYKEGETGWDIGHASPAIIDYFRHIEDKEVSILIPGGGNGHEAKALSELDFKQVKLLDFSKAPLTNFKLKNPNYPQELIVQADFFEHSGQYDYIIEQTFFCALSPHLRAAYVKKMKNLLKPSGKLIGLLFNVPLNKNKPPFGGHKKEYLPLFSGSFNVLQMELSQNSIPQRLGRELFIEMQPLKS